VSIEWKRLHKENESLMYKEISFYLSVIFDLCEGEMKNSDFYK